MVVGGGILGATIAFHLAWRGGRVTVVEAAEPGAGASAVSFSWLNAADKKPLAYSDMNRRSLDMWDGLTRRLGADVRPTWGGELRWAATEAGAGALVERIERHAAAGYPIRLVDRTEMVELEPGLAPGDVSAASLAELEGHVDTVAVVASCLARAAERGAEVRPGTKVTGFGLDEPNASGVAPVGAVLTPEGPIACDVAVLAAGAGSTDLAATAGLSLPLTGPFGATVLTEPLPPVLQSVAVLQTARDLATRVSIRQLPHGAVMLHGMADGVKGSLGRDDAEVARVVETAARFLPALADAEVAEVRIGPRPVPADGLPVFGFAPRVPNLYLAVAHNAITLAPLLSELAAQEIVGNTTVDLLAPYRIERFP